MAIIHEMYGIQAERLGSLETEYDKLLSLVSRIKSGEVDPERVVIEDRSWRIDDGTEL